MEEKKPSVDIVKKIKEEKITKKSYFQVHWKNYVFWILWSVIMIFGAISFSLLLLNVLDIRPTFLHELGLGRYLRILITTMPYLWLMLILTALSAGYFAMRRTRSGYRYNMIFITTIIVLAISLLGTLFHMSNFNTHVGERMMRDPRVMKMGFPAHERFLRPEEGILGGRIVEVSESAFVIENVRGDVWKILYDDKTDIRFRGQTIRVNVFVAVVGETVDKDVFQAKSIRILPRNLEHERIPSFDQFRPKNETRKKDL